MCEVRTSLSIGARVSSNPSESKAVGFNRNKFYTVPDGSIGANPRQEFFGFTNTTTNPTTAFGLPPLHSPRGAGHRRSWREHGAARQLRDQTDRRWRTEHGSAGSHALKAGFDIRPLTPEPDRREQHRGSFTFTGSIHDQPGPAGTGNSIADLLLGYPQEAAAADAGDLIGHFSTGCKLLLQDDWKISPRLS